METLPSEQLQPKGQEAEAVASVEAEEIEARDLEAEASERARNNLAGRVEHARADFLAQAREAAASANKDFLLRLRFAFSFILLKLGNQDTLIGEILAQVQKEYKNQWAPDLTTIQHYSGPMMVWMQRKAKQAGAQVPDKFKMSFLRQHPQYVLRFTRNHIEDLARECQTLVELDRAYGNDTIKKRSSGATKAPQTNPGATQTSPGSKPPSGSHSSQKKPSRPERKRETPEQKGTTKPEESLKNSVPTPDEVYVKLMVAYELLVKMREAGAKPGESVVRAMQLCVNEVNAMNGATGEGKGEEPVPTSAEPMRKAA